MKYSLTRHIEIEKPLSEVLPLVSDFRNWHMWSPWTVLEPGHTVSFSGNMGEVGAQMSWDGNIIGKGSLSVERLTDTRIAYNLQTLKPYKSKSKTSFLFEEKEGKTIVTWTLHSQVPFFLFFLVGTIRSALEMDYDRGLLLLKEKAEKGVIKAKTVCEGLVPFEGFSYVGIRNTSTMDQMPTDMNTAFSRIIEELGMESKHWISVYLKIKMSTQQFTYISAVSDERFPDKRLKRGFVRGQIQSGKMLKVTHYGSYTFLGNAWSLGMMTLKAQKLKKMGAPFESYRNSPHDTAPDDLITDIYFPVR